MTSKEVLKEVINSLFDENIRKYYKKNEVEKDLEQVYQDLEVLEILRKRLDISELHEVNDYNDYDGKLFAMKILWGSLEFLVDEDEAKVLRKWLNEE